MADRDVYSRYRIMVCSGSTTRAMEIGIIPRRFELNCPFSQIFGNIKAYIPLRRKTIGVGSWRWLTPPTPHFCLGDTNMLLSENAKTPDAKPKICVLPDAKLKRKPVEYRLPWVPTQKSGVGHVHFMFFVLISFALGSQANPVSNGIWA